MVDGPRILAVIPARGGSKRLPGKNVLPLARKPLIVWTIEAARGARYLSRVIVSTDDPEIAQLARACGVEVPFVRPPELASDTASSLDVITHALQSLQEQSETPFDYVMTLQPTSPLRTSEDIDSAIELLRDRQADAVVSVCRTDHPPEWCNALPEDLSMANFYRHGVRSKRSQDLLISYRLNGAIYLYDCGRLLRTGTDNMDDSCYAYVMPRLRSVDIDDAIDFEVAEVYMKRLLALRGVGSD